MAKSSAEAPGMAQLLDGEDEELDPLLCLAQKLQICGAARAEDNVNAPCLRATDSRALSQSRGCQSIVLPYVTLPTHRISPVFLRFGMRQ